MRLIYVLATIACVFTAAQSYADHEAPHGPCSSYFPSCKSDSAVTAASKPKEKWHAMHECVWRAAKADSANGQKCLDAMAKHKAEHDKEAAKEAK
jgi:hypothetical protein